MNRLRRRLRAERPNESSFTYTGRDLRASLGDRTTGTFRSASDRLKCIGGGKTHVVRPRGSRQDPVVWPGCVYAWLCTPARLGNRLTPVNGCPQRIGDPVPSRRTEDLLVGVSVQEA